MTKLVDHIFENITKRKSPNISKVEGSDYQIQDSGEFELSLDLFKKGGGLAESKRLEIPLIGQIPISNDIVSVEVDNLGQASTINATVQYVGSGGQVEWTSSPFTVNATNTTTIDLDSSNLSYSGDGMWQLYYQVRV